MTRPPAFPRLDRRANIPELMDSPEADPQALENTLRLLDVIKRYATRVRHILKKYVIRVMRENPQYEYHLIDLGAGIVTVSTSNATSGTRVLASK